VVLLELVRKRSWVCPGKIECWIWEASMVRPRHQRSEWPPIQDTKAKGESSLFVSTRRNIALFPATSDQSGPNISILSFLSTLCYHASGKSDRGSRRCGGTVTREPPNRVAFSVLIKCSEPRPYGRLRKEFEEVKNESQRLF
jgi:hypothetical protein